MNTRVKRLEIWLRQEDERLLKLVEEQTGATRSVIMRRALHRAYGQGPTTRQTPPSGEGGADAERRVA